MVRRVPHNSPAIMLRQINYGEADLVVSFLSPTHGLLRGYARGGRKSVKRFGPALEPFTQIEIRWQAGLGDLLTLLDADLIDARRGLRQSLPQLALASYCVELIEMLLQEGDPQPDIFSLMAGCLDFLADGGGTQLARLLFEIRLVKHLGYIPHLLHCSECFVRFEEALIAFDPLRGGSLCRSCAAGASQLEVGVGTLGSLSRALQTPIDLFAGFQFGGRTLRDGAAMMNLVLQLILPRVPKSQRFLQQTLSPADP
ncbi:DNA repair protein RecO [Geopsychrobacter electrodiphilus]|uniref:DNA repair protein RecO n=1 Tax=Geopsychrobacter electrodiphilus TaxID=225196 RepID=UPI00037A372E|nr:DNA repair protein RecO [Geopsychrobacter electrodiphilus]